VGRRSPATCVVLSDVFESQAKSAYRLNRAEFLALFGFATKEGTQEIGISSLKIYSNRLYIRRSTVEASIYEETGIRSMGDKVGMSSRLASQRA